MNNRFILILSFAMTISLVIFISLQLYWVRGYYRALEQDFSNKVHNVLEITTKKIEGIEIEQYLNTTTVEGMYTLKSIYKLLRNKKINIEVIDLVYNIIVRKEKPESLLTFLVEKD